ncbi:uncharacterized protein [Nicotiana sylvestris]|uniref:Ubiquitin-60S ribosomal protein L40-like isoform X2 n=1 Tax=Nicotiana sylvestris TaxID=4096 RepID=A0A1U7YWQ5_NICSY|nr:PREDICTED: ubiquitin-60S ribosomal protein L40-like isoform X2 [Nicotiana sylvestris]
MTHTGEASERHKSEGIDTTIEIKVKTMNSQTHNLRISNQGRVWNLKEHVSLLIGTRMEQQRLIYCGKALEDDVYLSLYFGSGGPVHLRLLLKPLLEFRMLFLGSRSGSRVLYHICPTPSAHGANLRRDVGRPVPMNVELRPAVGDEDLPVESPAPGQA